MVSNEDGDERMTATDEYEWESIGTMSQTSYRLRNCPSCEKSHTSNFDECFTCETIRLKEEEE
jgi:hypothetical protein